MEKTDHKQFNHQPLNDANDRLACKQAACSSGRVAIALTTAQSGSYKDSVMQMKAFGSV